MTDYNHTVCIWGACFLRLGVRLVRFSSVIRFSYRFFGAAHTLEKVISKYGLSHLFFFLTVVYSFFSCLNLLVRIPCIFISFYLCIVLFLDRVLLGCFHHLELLGPCCPPAFAP